MARSLLPSLFGSNKTQRHPFHYLQDEIDRVFEDFGRPLTFLNPDRTMADDLWLTPKVDVSESDDAIEVVAEIPGVKEDDIDITITNNVLMIKGEKAEEREEQEKNFHLIERSQGSYMRYIPLGFDVEPKDVQAAFDAGVLKVTIKKPEEIQAQSKKIAITRTV